MCVEVGERVGDDHGVGGGAKVHVHQTFSSGTRPGHCDASVLETGSESGRPFLDRVDDVHDPGCIKDRRSNETY